MLNTSFGAYVRGAVKAVCLAVILSLAACGGEAGSASPQDGAKPVAEQGDQQTTKQSPPAVKQPIAPQKGISAHQSEASNVAAGAHSVDGDWVLDLEASRPTVHSQPENDFNAMKGMRVSIDPANNKLVVLLPGGPARTYDFRLLSRSGNVLTVGIDKATATLDTSTAGQLRWEDQGDVLVFTRNGAEVDAQ